MRASDNKQIQLSKKNKREMSAFIGRELLYDYATHKIDDERRAALDAYIKNSPEAQAELIELLNGLHYADRLSETLVAEPILEKVLEPNNYLTVLGKKANLESLPQSLRWVTEAVAVGFIILILSIVIPWKKIFIENWFARDKHLVLTELDRHAQPSIEKLRELEAFEKPEFEDEEANRQVLAGNAEKHESKQEAPIVTKQQNIAEPATQPKVAEPKAAVSEKEQPKKISEGFLFRGDLAVTNLEAIGPKLKDKIMDLGGRKAGEVELGWRKSPQTAYFHFTIPEAKYSELISFLSVYGSAKLVKEKHPRVMPDGIIRVIITVNEANSQ